MALATLSVDLVARIAQFEQDLGKLARGVEQRAAQMERAFAGVATSLAALGVGLSAGAAFAWVKNVANGIDAMNDLKDATGASIENISALEDVARRTGTGFDTVSTSLVKFNQALNTAKPGSDAAAAFDLLNLNVAELKALDPAEALLRTATALAGFADDGNKARLTQELFGKSLKEVAPFLKDLAEAGQLNATVTAKQAEEAEKFNKELFKLQKNSEDAARALAGPLVESMNTLIERFRAGKREGDGFLVTLLKQTEIARLLNLNDAGGGFGGGGRGSGLAALTGSSEIGGAYDRSAARLKRQGKLSVGEIPEPSKTSKVARESVVKTYEFANREIDQFIEKLEREIEKNQELTAVQTAQLRISEATALGFSEAKRTRLLDLAAQVDKEKELLALQEDRIKVGRALAIEQGVDNSAYQADLKRLLDATPSAKLRAISDDVRLLADEFEAGRLGADDYVEAVKARIDSLGESAEKTKSLSEELGLSFTSAFEDAVVGGKKLGDILKGLEQDIIRIVTRQLVTKPLSDALGKTLGGEGGLGGMASKFLGSLFSFDGGGFTGAGSRAGGIDGKGGFLGVLHPQESVIDHSRGQRTGNVVSITVNQSFGAGTSRATSLQAAADARRQLEYAGRNM